MLKDWQKLLISVVGCEAIGILGTPFTINAIPNLYEGLNKPFFAPPNWLFGPAWTLLYFLMGVSLYLIWRQDWKKSKIKSAIFAFLIQLFLNGIWSPIFFGLRSPLLGLITIVLMWISIIVTMRRFWLISRTAFYLLLPYICWVSFALLLNAAILALN
ncbi:MAG: tryptophan-rich sensory protein [bacterium]|nr:tryptophan-rich sensory protein [bacterium]